MSWYLPGVVRRIARKWLLDWRALPERARHAWWKRLGWGLLAASILSLLLMAATRQLEGSGALQAEEAILARIGDIDLISFNDAIWLDVFGNGFALTALIVASAGIAASLHRPLVSVALLLGYGSLFLPVLIGWLTWQRDRPTLIADGLGSPGASISSFPSGHLVQAIVAFGLLIYLWIRSTRAPLERGLAAVVFLLLIAAASVSRLRLGAHWPSDMAAAALIGFFWLGAVIHALRSAERLAPAPAAASVPRSHRDVRA